MTRALQHAGSHRGINASGHGDHNKTGPIHGMEDGDFPAKKKEGTHEYIKSFRLQRRGKLR
jgi:hypothetical protein